jgi:hypothetical protein
VTGRLRLACAIALVAATGCVRRTITIKSDPPGARVVLNDKDLGVTPLTEDLEWYGWYRLRLTKPGYERIDDEVEIRAPLHLWIPLDLAMEVVPLQIHDPNVLAYRLIPDAPAEDPIPAGFREQYGIDPAQLEREAVSPGQTEPAVAPPTDTDQPAVSGEAP